MLALRRFKLVLQEEKSSICLLVFIWVIAQTIAFFSFSMRASVDSEIYITNAINLTKGTLPEGKDILYTSYSLLITIPYLLEIDTKYTIIFNLIFAFISVICLYKTTQLLSNSNIASFIATLAYIGWFKFLQWNLILYTDGVFSSLIIISTYLLLSKKEPKRLLLTLLVLIFTFFMRPTGIGLFFATSAYMISVFREKYQLSKSLKISLFILTVFVTLFTLNLVLSGFVDSFIDSYSKAEIIYPNIPLFFSPSPSLLLPSNVHAPLLRLTEFILGNPFYMIKITLLKGVLFVTHVKPYYSSFHNLFIGLYLYPLYYFAIKGLREKWNRGAKIFITTFIISQIVTVSLSSENWDGRFLLPVLPLVFILSGIGIQKHFSNSFKNYKLT